jgi:hypothetical protein
VLESADRADSNSAVRKDVWVQVPPAVPDRVDEGVVCRASPSDPVHCVDARGLGGAYPYLLGIYLGDGMLTRAPRNVWRLRVSLDTKYPRIVARVKAAIFDVAARTAGEVARQGCVELYSNWKHGCVCSLSTDQAPSMSDPSHWIRGSGASWQAIPTSSWRV